jgi:Ctr copper transporter family
MSMDMGTMTNMTTMSMSMMSMTFFTSTMTPLYSAMWSPTSTGQYAGTCIFLVILATIFRGLLAVKAWKETAWLDAEFNRRYVTVAGKLPKAERIASDSDSKRMILTENGVEEDVVVVKKRSMGIRPWRITTDPIRAAMDTLIAGVGYLL